jgi:hypothetical protein
MHEVHQGQCGLCVHFGEYDADKQKLIQIRTRHEAPEDLIEECGLPRNVALHLKVTPLSGCDNFMLA